ncbi:MAG: hypothetical protein ACFFFK_09575, partial [Candidatus Thorarchaeota archaeon]
MDWPSKRKGIAVPILLVLFGVTLLLGWNLPSEVSSTNEQGLVLKLAFPNLSFVRPVDLQNANDGTNRLFVVEKPGLIRVFNNTHDVNETH